ncbi:OmpA family protein [Anaeromicropila herbilytica]|uniref:Chemotaxis protein MotB n=1 Tax=Anaeromicropila herbilytica TaxID=2785025 RepID=A0A7R7ELC7_9FIRM|nr:OmpA family protein [Anaeromicropila herbilytica]BCN30710.1 chemotaxis protein MotB [Anaeromicropila herbilytica]
MKRKAKKSGNNERWLLTYSDMITLLVALFVVLYAMSNVSESKYAQLAESLNSSLGNGVLSGQDSLLPGKTGLLDGGKLLEQSSGDTNTATTGADKNKNGISTTTQTGKDNNTLEKEEFEKLRDQINQIAEKSNIKGNVTMTTEKRGLVITFSDKIFFDSGKALIKSNMNKTLKQIATLLNSTDNSIVVEGHTDNVPIKNAYYSSNWQLSSIRATNVVEYLISNCNISPSRLRAVGYGEYKPVASNKTKAGQNKNRRVNIVLLYNNVESE